MLSSSINDIADEDGWAYLGELGNLLLKKQPDFDARNYGFNKLLQLLKSFPNFEVDIRESGKKTGKLVYVRTI
jgi:Fe-S-cluster formation regulator IscX/YfhJ